MASGVYQIKNLSNGKCYIGSSVDIDARWAVHKAGAQTNMVINDAFKKYGIDGFEFSILEECSVEILIEREQHYLDLYKPYAETFDGYNIRKIASSNLGLLHSDETKRKMSASHTGTYRSAATKEKMSQLQKERGGYGPKEFTEEHKRKLSESHKGQYNAPWSDERKAAHSIRMKSAYKNKNAKLI